MSHNHGHGGHGQGHHHEGCDDHLRAEDGEQQSLYGKIDRQYELILQFFGLLLSDGPAALVTPVDNVVALNASDESPARGVFKPFDLKEDETVWIESDADAELIIHVPFTGNIKLRSISIKAPPGDEFPEKLLVFSNKLLSFDDVASAKATQEFQLVSSSEAVEYDVRPSKFPSVSSVTLFFPSSTGGDETKVFYIGFKGSWSPFTKDPSFQIVYEAVANPKDHKAHAGGDGQGYGLQ